MVGISHCRLSNPKIDHSKGASMLEWLREWFDGVPGWGRVLALVAVVALLAYALFLGRDLTPIWGLLN